MTGRGVYIHLCIYIIYIYLPFLSIQGMGREMEATLVLWVQGYLGIVA